MKKQKFLTNLIILTSLVAVLIISANVFLVTIGKYHLWSKMDLDVYASSSSTRTQSIQARRGTIYDRNGIIIANDATSYNIVIYLDESRVGAGNRPAYVDDFIKTAQVLAEVLEMDELELYQLLVQKKQEGKYQVEIGSKGRGLNKETKDLINTYELNGVEFTTTVTRNYPLGTFASYLIGFAQQDENGELIGKMGLEKYLNEELTGVNGKRTYQADKNGYILQGMKSEVEEAVNGYDVVLTIDQALQETLESAFEMTIEQFGSERVWGSVMEIDTGKILAWGQTPGFDLNKLDITEYTNYGSQYAYEPGSTMKVFTYASAIDNGSYDYTGLVDSSPYCYAASGRNPVRVSAGASNQIGCINNANQKTYGMITYDTGLVYSANTVAASIIDKLIAPSVYEDYLTKFGFFNYVNTDGISEVTGTKNYTWPADKLALTYGQGSTVTMLQLLQGFSAIFSDGTMVKPYFIDEIRSSYNTDDIIYKAETEVVGNPIAPETADYLQDVLYRVVYDSDGTARFYQIDETEIIGKTGTAQVAKTGSYGTNTIASIVLALPADNPKYLIYYAFEGTYNKSAHVQTEPVKSVIRKVAQLYNLTDLLVLTTEEDDVHTEIKDEIVPSLNNHSVDYAIEKCQDLNLQLYVFGSGKDVVYQAPSAGSYTTTSGKVFIATESNQLELPDMTGWTRSDITLFWELALKVVNIGITMDGYGKVVSQSISPGTLITNSTQLTLILE